MNPNAFLSTVLLLAQGMICGCVKLGPNYQPPRVEHETDFKAQDLGRWKAAQPRDHLPKGPWWEIFDDIDLNQLQSLAAQNNQELKAAFARMNQARSTARMARADLLPALNSSPGYRRERFSPNQEPNFGNLTASTIRVPLDLSYEVDLWGRISRGFESARAQADATQAAYHHILLTLQADLAQNYFSLRALDAEIGVLHQTLELRREQIGIVSNRFEIGLGTELDLARAVTEEATTRAELATLRRNRAELENAIAVLIGESPSNFKLATMAKEWTGRAPEIPSGLPSDLLERRPDIAEAERILAAANAGIGIAKAAFFPSLRLTGSGGYLSAEATSLFDWESRVWTLGPSVSLPLFAGGRNRANLRNAEARYEESIAAFRQKVLVAFSEVEDALAGIFFLDEQMLAQQAAFESAMRAYELAGKNFSAGISNYLDVIDAGRAALLNHRANIRLLGERHIASVQLIKALGGGWE